MPAADFHFRLRMAMRELYTQFPLVDSVLMNLSRRHRKMQMAVAAAAFGLDGLPFGLDRCALADGRLPPLERGAGDDETAAVSQIGNFMPTKHVVNGFLADSHARRDLGDCNCRVQSVFAIHGGDLRRRCLPASKAGACG